MKLTSRLGDLEKERWALHKGCREGLKNRLLNRHHSTKVRVDAKQGLLLGKEHLWIKGGMETRSRPWEDWRRQGLLNWWERCWAGRIYFRIYFQLGVIHIDGILRCFNSIVFVCSMAFLSNNDRSKIVIVSQISMKYGYLWYFWRYLENIQNLWLFWKFWKFWKFRKILNFFENFGKKLKILEKKLKILEKNWKFWKKIENFGKKFPK